MHHQNTVFSELLNHIPRDRFKKIVAAHDGDKHIRTLDSWTHMTSLIYAQFQGNTSLRDIQSTLSSHNNLTYHLGIKKVCRSTLSDANTRRSPEIFTDVFSILLGKLQEGSKRKKQYKELKTVLRLIDATPIGLGLCCRDWAQVSDQYIAAKAHFIYDPDANIPVYFSITNGKAHDLFLTKNMSIEAGVTYVFDKGYYDFSWWAKLDQKGCRFVTRLKRNAQAEVVKINVPTGENIVGDQLIRFTKQRMKVRHNPLEGKVLREIQVQRENGEILRLITNDLVSPAIIIADLYKRRWAIELFFKWVKQNLKIKKFLGMSENAVKIQIIIAMIAFLLVQLVNQDLPKIQNMTALTRLVAANIMQRKTCLEMLEPPPEPLKLQDEKYQLVMNFEAC